MSVWHAYYSVGSAAAATVTTPVERLDAASSGAASTLAYAVSAGTDRCLIIGVTQEANPTSDCTVDYGGQSATQIASVAANVGGTQARVQLFRVMEAGIAAASGSTITATGLSGVYTLHAASYQYIDQTAPVSGIDTDFSDTTTPNPLDACDVTVPTSGLGVAIAMSGDAATATWANMTEQTDRQSASSTGSLADTLTPGATSVDCTWTSQSRASIAAAALNPSSSAPPSPPPGTDYVDAVLALTPTAYWRLGDASGGAADSSGNGYTLTDNGSSTYGEAGWASDGSTAMKFTSSSTYLRRSDEAWMDVGTNDFSVVFVIKMASWAINSVVLGHNAVGNAGEWGVRLGSSSDVVSGRLSADGNYNLFTSAASLVDGAFHHVAVTFDRSDVATIYVDGTEVDTVDISAEAAEDLTNAQAIIIGYLCYVTICEVAFWNGTLLTGAQVATLHGSR